LKHSQGTTIIKIIIPGHRMVMVKNKRIVQPISNFPFRHLKTTSQE